jgi:hypothetical protein
MPITDHPSFIQPEPDTVLWRYMDFPKFCALITKSFLWFPSAYVLAQDDPFEGLLPIANYAHRNWRTFNDLADADKDHVRRSEYGPFNHLSYKIDREKWNRDNNIRTMFILQRATYINCWHCIDNESVAMWKLYAGANSGVAVKTTAARLKKSLLDVEEDIFFGKVRYVSADDPPVDTGNAFNATVTKRTEFSYEHEVRLVYSSDEWHDMPLPIWNALTGQFTNSPKLAEFEAGLDCHGKSFRARSETKLSGISGLA